MDYYLQNPADPDVTDTDQPILIRYPSGILLISHFVSRSCIGQRNTTLALVDLQPLSASRISWNILLEMKQPRFLPMTIPLKILNKESVRQQSTGFFGQKMSVTPQSTSLIREAGPKDDREEGADSDEYAQPVS
jgi:hypothetical protein